MLESGPDGSNPHAIVTGQNDPTGVAVDGSHIYWANGSGGTINAANLDGSNPQALVTGQNSPVGLAVPAPVLAFTPAPFSYGRAASQAFTLTNIGAAVEGPLTVTLTGAAAFGITGDTAAASDPLTGT